MHNHIKGFDGIRALAVIAVVLTHLHAFEVMVDEGLLARSLIPMISGSTGVQAFFVMSGFLITSLLVKEFNTTGTISIRNFIVRRTLRIFPLYILFLVIATALHIFGRNVTSWDSLFYVYIYSYNFIPKEFYTSFMGHTWSLAVEEHFYLIWPAVFLLLFGKGRLSIMWLLLVFIVSAPLIHLMLIRTGFAESHFVERWSFIAGSSIAMGCLSALLISHERTDCLTQRLGAHPGSLVFGILLYANSIYLYSDSWFLQNIGASYLRAIGITLMILWLYFNQSGMSVRVLEFGPLKYIGTISYGVYMYQGLLLATGPEAGLDPSRSWPPTQDVGLVLLLFAAPLSYHFFEKPFLRLKERFSTSRSRIKRKVGESVA